jgi:hypothetical protein
VPGELVAVDAGMMKQQIAAARNKGIIAMAAVELGSMYEALKRNAWI